MKMSVDYQKFQNEYITLNSQKMEKLKNKIKEYLSEDSLIKRVNLKNSSYIYKTMFEKLLEFNISHADLKKAMKELEIPNFCDGKSMNIFYPLNQNFFNRLSSDTDLN